MIESRKATTVLYSCICKASTPTPTPTLIPMTDTDDDTTTPNNDSNGSGPTVGQQSTPRALALPSKSLVEQQFELYGWKPDPTLSDDENYLDLVFIITRNPARRISMNNDKGDDDDEGDNDDGNDGNLVQSSPNEKPGIPPKTPPQQLPQGHMGALIVRPSTTWSSRNAGDNDVDVDVIGDENGDEYESRFWDNILGAATNTPLFVTSDRGREDNIDHHNRILDLDVNAAGWKKSTMKRNHIAAKSKADIHAEISALGQACKSCQSTEQCTAYITIHPCKNCFGALVAFGITRIVTRQAKQNWSPITLRTSGARGITVHTLSHDEQRRQMERINRLINTYHSSSNAAGQGPDGGGGVCIQTRSDEQLMAIAESIRRRRQERRQKKQKEANSYEEGLETIATRRNST